MRERPGPGWPRIAGLALAAALSGCGQSPGFVASRETRRPVPAPDRGAAVADEQRAESALEQQTRITVLEQSVAGLQKEVDDIKASRQQLDTDLVTQRLAALEAAVQANAAVAASPPSLSAQRAERTLIPADPSPRARGTGRVPLDRDEVIERASQH